MKSDFTSTKQLFDLPNDLIYLDGNSLGPPTKLTPSHVTSLITEKWAKLLIKGWNQDNWITKPQEIGNRIAKLIGAEDNSVLVGDTLSIKTYQALFSAIKLINKKTIILSDNQNFPSDLYIAQGLIDTLNSNYELRIVDPTQVFDALSEDVSVLFLTEVNYKTGKKHDVKRLSRKARTLGTITIWDLAHSTGVIPINVKDLEIDFAVGCTYKYLNGGPGSPAFLYVAPKHHKNLNNPIKGWLGHASPFNFTNRYIAASGIAKMQIGTPSIIAFSALEAALDIFDTISIGEIRKKSMELSDLFIQRINKHCPALKLISPRLATERGAHIAYKFEESYAVMQCLIETGVIGDFRAPNIMRFGFNPLFVDHNDTIQASDILTDIINHRRWDRADLKVKSFVT